MVSAFVASDPAGYERYMGRWSQRLAPLFVEWADVSAGERVLDVGCGTGNLTLALARAGVSAVTGVDASAPYLSFARLRTKDRAVTFDLGDAYKLPYTDGTFDRALSMLTLDVLAEPGRAIAEMRRVTRRGGTVAGLISDFRCGFTAFSLLLDTAAPLEPSAGTLRDEMMSDQKGWPDGLAGLLREAGLASVREGRLSMFFDFESFTDYWSTFTTGQGRFGRWLMSLTESQRSVIEHHLRPAYLCGWADGPRQFATAFWVAAGLVAAS